MAAALATEPMITPAMVPPDNKGAAARGRVDVTVDVEVAEELGETAVEVARTLRFLNRLAQAVESAMQAKSITRDWRLYPQHVDSESYPHEVTGISLAAYFGLAKIVEALMDNSVNDTEGALFWATTGGSAEVISFC